jgi:dihydroorotase, multifunctional complex type
LKRAEQANNCRVWPIASITKGLKGEELTEMGLLLQEGAVAFSDDGKPVSHSAKMRLALQYAKNFDALLMQHCEDMDLAAEGVMNEGSVSVRIGLKGIPASAESIMVARDIELAREYDGRIHFCHMSTASSMELIRRAKAEGLKVSCETAPHYFAANEKWVEEREYDPCTKMNPPLRSERDVEAIIAGLADGTIDAIATDHAPHHRDEKEVEFNIALNGIVGLETAFSLGYTHLVKTNKLSFERLVECMSTTPCRLLGVPGGILDVGAVADITMLNPDASITYTADMLHSKGKNTPFLNREYSGRVVHTMVGGEWKI